MRKMYKIVVLVLCCRVSSQPVKEELSIRRTRELIECCPCPTSNPTDGGQDMLDKGSQFGRADDLDDCPCRPRSADSEGASSLFFPSAVRSDGVDMRSDDTKGDTKNLLEPEVTLATSMLDTLRQATEEDYQDALARDAARIASEIDAVPEESARNVVFIVNPKEYNYDDNLPFEPSLTQNSPYIYPDQSEPLPASVNLLEILKIPKLIFPVPHKTEVRMDNDVEASNLKPSTMNNSEKGTISPQQALLQKFTSSLKHSVNNYNDALFLEKPNLNDINLNRLKITKNLLLPLTSKFDKNKISSSDLNDLLPDVQNQLQNSNVNSLQLLKQPKLPLQLKNLLKLKDIELIPKSIKTNPFNKSLPRSSQQKISLLPLNENELTFKNKCNNQLGNGHNIERLQRNKNKGIILTPQLIESVEQVNADSNLDDCIFNGSHCKIVLSELSQSDTLHSQSQMQPSILKLDKNSDLQTANNQHIESISKLNISTDLKNQFEETESNLSNTFDVNSEQRNKYYNLDEKNVCQSEDSINNHHLEHRTYLDSQSSAILLETKENNAKNLLKQKMNNYENDLKYNYDLERYASQNEKEKIKPVNPITNQNFERLSSTKMVTPLSIELVNFKNDNVKNSNVLNETPVQSYTEFTNTKEICNDSEENMNDKLKNKNVTHYKTIQQPPAFLEHTETVKFDPTNTINMFLLDDIQVLSDKVLNLDLLQQKHRSSSELLDSKINNNENYSELNVLKDEKDNQSSDTIINNMDNLGNLNQSLNSNVLTAYPSDVKCNSTEQDEIENILLGSQGTNNTEMDIGASDIIIQTVPGISNSIYSNIQPRAQLFENLADPLKDSFRKLEKVAGSTLNFDKCWLPQNNLREQPLGLENLPLQHLNKPVSSFNKRLEDDFNVKTNIPYFDNFRERSSLFKGSSRPTHIVNLSKKILEKGITTNLPFFNDIQGRSDNSLNERTSVEETSLGSSCINESSGETMIPKASTISFKKKLPTLLNLEDFNIKSLRKDPLSITNQMRNAQKHNTNLNPLREKNLGNNDNSILRKGSKLSRTVTDNDRPSLFLKHEKITNPFKNKPTIIHSSRKPLEALSPMEELKNTLHSNNKNVLSRTVQPNPLLLSNDVENIAETIRQNTRKTMKGVQQKMKSFMKNSNIDGSLGDPFAKPQEFLDDVHDRLKGIHYDLNDRLSAIHEDILDSSTLKTIINKSRKPPNRNVMPSLQQQRKKPHHLHTAASNVIPLEVDPHKYNFNNEYLLSDLNYRNRFDKAWNISPKQQDLPEGDTKSSKVQVLKQTTSFLSNLQNLSRLSQNSSLIKNSNERKPISQLLREMKMFNDNITPYLIVTEKPFKNERLQNKITISFATTTDLPIISSQQTSQFEAPESPQSEKYASHYVPNLNNDYLRKKNIKSNFKLKSTAENNVSPTELEPVRTLPVPKLYNEEYDNIDNISVEEKHEINLKPPFLRKKSSNKISNIPSHITWPGKSTTELRPGGNIQLEPKLDKFLRTPFSNTEIVLDEPLKENVSYRCRMMCTKEIT